MNAPTVTEIKEWSQFDWEEAGYGTDQKLGVAIARAAAEFRMVTGLALADVPDWQEPLVQQAVQGLTEQIVTRASPDIIETLADFDLIQSFSAGNYSETRRSAEDAKKARQINAWPWLNDLLWGLLTPERREEWEIFFGDDVPPAWSVSEMDWDAYHDVPAPGLGNHVMFGRDA